VNRKAKRVFGFLCQQCGQLVVLATVHQLHLRYCPCCGGVLALSLQRPDGTWAQLSSPAGLVSADDLVTVLESGPATSAASPDTPSSQKGD
jgi:hypothetical protein